MSGLDVVRALLATSRSVLAKGIVCVCLLMLPAASVLGHVVYPCLQEVARAAQALKQCTSSRKSDACRDSRQELSDQVRACRQQAFTAESIDEAIREGESKVSGGSSYYLPKRSVASPQSAIDTSRGNIANFRQQFANVSAFPVEDLDYGANKGGCHQAFLASAGRYQFLGHFELKRYALNDDLRPAPYRLYFFSRMSEGVCYAAPDAGQTMDNGDLAVVNIPGGFFSFLKQADRQAGAEAVVVECGAESECTRKKRDIVALQVDYHANYLRLQRMYQCRELAADNRWYRRMAKLRLQKESVPSYCMEDDLDQNIQHLRKSLDDTAKKLFEPL